MQCLFNAIGESDDDRKKWKLGVIAAAQVVLDVIHNPDWEKEFLAAIQSETSP
jgi:hypothetical protein